MVGLDLAREVTCAEPERFALGAALPPRFRVVAYDFGVKRNILRMLAAAGCDVTVVPAQTSAEQSSRSTPTASSSRTGRATPSPVPTPSQSSRELIERGLPIFGICLGHQILGLACGGRTFKLKFGHRGANHPVKNLATGQVEITSQNHGFAVEPALFDRRASSS